MHLMQIVEIRLLGRADNVLTMAQHTRVMEWLKNWTPQGNFKAVIGLSRQDCVDKLRLMLQGGLVPAWLEGVDAKLFEFRVGEAEVDPAGWFWPPGSLASQWWKVAE